MNNIAGINFAETLINISNNAVRYILMLLFISFLISLIFIIIQNYVNDDNSIWYAVAAYFNIILVTLAFIIYVRTIYIPYSGNNDNDMNMRNMSNASYDDQY
ncbi:unknown similar to AMEV198 [Adoxophyes honmai entomopoxvirus 'L']|uniref:Uncharacterized protein n=1 Tax=Adoxophyes honmai entomopoxvirus 'L' TaxID=1293540 RepID=A0A916P683_9POXV|nr:unknown similar to AMEV198 [Adoxophyes honmai entomopoxvirus 'L']CCU55470.1 unknown similar to AMEV198 [Adoxophyes honmai entomopoxvirus 'L']